MQTAKPTCARELQAALLVALSGILYGLLGYTGVTLLNQNLSITSMLFWRFFIAAIWVTLTMAYINKNNRRIANIHADSFTKITHYFIFLPGALFYSGTSLFYFMASERIGTGLAMILFFAYPVLVVLYSWFIKRQEFNKCTILSLVFITLGMLLLNHGKTIHLDHLGVSLALLAAASFAAYIIWSKQIVKQTNPYLLTQWICLGSALLFLTGSLPHHQFAFPTHAAGWLAALVIGIVCTALPIQLLSKGLEVINASKASILSVLEPITTVLIGATFLHESISLSQWLGVAIVLVGALLVQLLNKDE